MFYEKDVGIATFSEKYASPPFCWPVIYCRPFLNDLPSNLMDLDTQRSIETLQP